jgi:HSP20 family protein
MLERRSNMSLIRWDPFRGFNTAISTTAWNPSVDILETDNDVVVKAELPGLDPKSIDVRLENNVLLLKGDRHFEKETKEENYHRIEREYGSFSRAFSLPMAVKEEKITAEYKDGILKIVLPKKEELKPRTIRIEAA